MLPRLRSVRRPQNPKGAKTTAFTQSTVIHPYNAYPSGDPALAAAMAGLREPSAFLDLSLYPDGSLARRNAEVINEEFEIGVRHVPLWSPHATPIPPDPNPWPHLCLWRKQ